MVKEKKEKSMKPGQLSEHFLRSEFECGCGCGFDTVDAELIRVLEDIHNYFSGRYRGKVRIIITSGNRCLHYNEIVQKQYQFRYVPYSSRSHHMDAIASDFKVEQKLNGVWIRIKADVVADYLEKKYPNCYGIGRYYGRTHLDIRLTKARWDKR